MLKYLINKVLKETKIRKEPQQDDSEQSLNGSSSRAKNKIQRLFSIIAKLRQRIRQLSNNAKCSDEEVMSLKNEVEQLKAQLHEKKNSLKRNSNSSSKPPSSDMGKKGKKNNTNSREPSGKASGGQFGHKGNTLEFEEHPDHNVELPLKCESCNKNHMDKEQAFEIVREQRRQVFELVLSSTVTEYTGYEGTCKCCGNTCSSIFPKGVEQPVQYGLKARAMMSLLSMYQLIPLERTCELMGDLMNRKGPVQGTIVNTNGRLCQSI